jgi:hypothetical protein
MSFIDQSVSADHGGIAARGGIHNAATGGSSISAPATAAANRFADLSEAQQQEVVRRAAGIGGSTYNFAFKLSLGTPIDVPLEIANKVLGIIGDVTSHFRR